MKRIIAFTLILIALFFLLSKLSEKEDKPVKHDLKRLYDPDYRIKQQLEMDTYVLNKNASFLHRKVVDSLID